MSQQGRSRALEILLVEDSPADARLAQEAFGEGRIPKTITIVNDGVEAIAYLRRTNRFSDAVRPDLILLDLNMPKKDGREVLAEIKNDPDLKQIPVIILSTSAADSDVKIAYDSHANCYLVKPVGFDQFNEVIRAVEQFWLDHVKLPPSP